MAEPRTPAGEPTGEPRSDADPVAEPRFLEPPTEAELTGSGEPTADEIHAAAGEPEASDRTDTEVQRPAESEVIPPAHTERMRPAETEVLRPVDSATDEAGTAHAAPTEAHTPATEAAAPQPPVAPGPQPVLAPAAATEPAPPRRRGNRVVATAWVVLAAGLFQVLYFGALALIILLLSGPNAVVPGLTNIARFPFAWLPVLFFFLLFELTVLLLNRAGRFAYVVASLVVGLLVYIISVLLISIIVGGGIGDTPTLARAFEAPEFVLTGLVAREVMLWTGFAIGSRGIRVRRRNAEDRARYAAEAGDDRG